MVKENTMQSNMQTPDKTIRILHFLFVNSLHNKAQYYSISVRVIRVNRHQDVYFAITQSPIILDILIKNCWKLLLLIERHVSLIVYSEIEKNDAILRLHRRMCR